MDLRAPGINVRNQLRPTIRTRRIDALGVTLPDFSVDTSTGSPEITVGSGIITITISAPSIYAGTYNVLVADFDAADAVNLVPPVIAGIPAVGEDLTITPGLWLFEGTETATTYQNARDGTPAAAVTFPTYTVVADDAGTDVTVIETFKGVAAASNALSVPAASTLDDFEVSDRLLTAHTGPSGRTYSEQNAGSGVGRIVNGDAVCTDIVGRAMTSCDDSAGNVNGQCTVLVRMENRVTDSANGAPFMRLVDADTYYTLQYAIGSSTWLLRKYVTGQSTVTLDSFADSFPVGEKRLVTVRCTGSLIEGLIDGVVEMSATDTQLTSGLSGARMYGGGNGVAVGTVIELMDFEDLD